MAISFQKTIPILRIFNRSVLFGGGGAARWMTNVPSLGTRDRNPSTAREEMLKGVAEECVLELA
jgi:hypothetical protein